MVLIPSAFHCNKSHVMLPLKSTLMCVKYRWLLLIYTVVKGNYIMVLIPSAFRYNNIYVTISNVTPWINFSVCVKYHWFMLHCVFHIHPLKS